MNGVLSVDFSELSCFYVLVASQIWLKLAIELWIWLLALSIVYGAVYSYLKAPSLKQHCTSPTHSRVKSTHVKSINNVI